MEKINFEDGQLVTEGYVEIDGTQHQIHEAEYEGSTPLSAHTLNLMQTNIEEEINNSSVVVSATEPTENNRKKVWMQKGKNLLNSNDVIENTKNGITVINNKNGTIKINGKAEIGFNLNLLTNINQKLKSNYALSFKIISGSMTGGSIRISINNNSSIDATNTNARILSSVLTTNSISTVSTGEIDDVATYLSIYINTGCVFNNCIISFQLEQGSTATSYEAYIEPKIYVLNDNNIYEEFIKKEKNMYSSEEQRIGTWRSGKPLYRKIIETTAPLTNATGTYVDNDTTIGNNISNAIVEFAYIIDLNNVRRQLPYTISTGHTVKTSITSDMKLKIYNGITNYNSCTVIASILYTKTTD